MRRKEVVDQTVVAATRWTARRSSVDSVPATTLVGRRLDVAAEACVRHPRTRSGRRASHRRSSLPMDVDRGAGGSATTRAKDAPESAQGTCDRSLDVQTDVCSGDRRPSSVGRFCRSPEIASETTYRAVVMGTEADKVVGIHRPDRPATVWVWGAMGFVWVLALINFPDDHDAVRRAFNGSVGVVWLVLAWLLTRARSVVDEEGVRVVTVLGRRWVKWDAVTSVSEPNRWDPESTLTVTTDAGKAVLTHVPKPLRQRFIDYANACRAATLPRLD